MPRSPLALALATLLCLLAAGPAAAYIVILRDGSRIVARDAIQLEGDMAIIVLQNGTRTSIAAAEIDLDRTRAANREEIGAAVVIDAGTVTEIPVSAPPRRETLADALARRETPRSELGPVEESTLAPEPQGVRPADLRSLTRRPFRSLEVAGEVQSLFRARGIGEILIFQGTRPDRLLLDITTNSEVAVFRSLEVAADTLLHLRERSPDLAGGFELVLATSEREPAGQFVITPPLAQRLAGKQIEASAFFIEQVRF